MRYLFVIIASIVMVPQLAVGQSQQQWFFAVLSDPQFGMYAKTRTSRRRRRIWRLLSPI
jgi:hypothetical protein